jgi:energy-coupling factor transporter transmembrane protein EcfT
MTPFMIASLGVFSATFAAGSMVLGYQHHAFENHWSIGTLFHKGTWLHKVALYACFAALLFPVTVGHWWYAGIVIVAGSLLYVLAIKTMKQFTQPISIVLLALGIVATIVMGSTGINAL